MLRLFVLLVTVLSFSSVCIADVYRDNRVNDRLKGSLNNTLYNHRIREKIDQDSLSFSSVSERENHGVSFVLKPLPYGLVMTFRAEKNNTGEREKSTIVFKRLFSFVPQSSAITKYTTQSKLNVVQLNSNTIGDISCFTYSTYKSCNISTLDNSFWVSLDYASRVFQKGIKYVFPTDVKVTVGINMPSIPSNHVIGLVTSFKTRNGRLETSDDELYTEDKRVSTGNLTYFSFETFATDNTGSLIDVGMDTVQHNNIGDNSEEDDNGDEHSNDYEGFKVFTFSSLNGLSYILWDPMIGTITSSNTGTSSSTGALSGAQIAGIIVGSAMGALVIAVVAVLFAKKRGRTT
jgi:hypothetical protein